MVINNTKINLDQVCTINVRTKQICCDYEYRKETRFLYWVLEKEGFYYVYTLNPYRVSEEVISKKETLYVEDKVVYYKPHVEFKMSNDHRYEKFFDTVPQLEEFMNLPEISSLKLIDKH